MGKTERFDFVAPLIFHAKGDEMIFEGMASVFGSLVQAWVPTVIDAGAFTRTLKKNGARIKLLNQHDPHEPIGKPIELKEIDSGLFIRGKISPTTAGKTAWLLMKDKVLDGLSIGFDPVKTRNEIKNGETIRHISDLDLMEISLVTFAADPAAKITATHGRQFLPNLAARQQQLAILSAGLERQMETNIPSFVEKHGKNWMF